MIENTTIIKFPPHNTNFQIPRLTSLLRFSSLLLFVFLLTSTDFKNYYLLLNERKYEKLSLKGDNEVLKRTIVFTSIKKPNENPYLEKDESAKTAFFVYLIKKRKYQQCSNFLRLHNSQLNIHHFYLGLDYFMKGSYSKAKEELIQYNENHLKYHKNLLIADCIYEQKGYSSKEDLINAYQEAMDVASSDLQKEIVKNRIKYIIYKK